MAARSLENQCAGCAGPDSDEGATVAGIDRGAGIALEAVEIGEEPVDADLRGPGRRVAGPVFDGAGTGFETEAERMAEQMHAVIGRW